MTSAFAVIKRYYGVVIMVGGLVLIAMGILDLTGELSASTSRSSSGPGNRSRFLELGLRSDQFRRRVTVLVLVRGLPYFGL